MWGHKEIVVNNVKTRCEPGSSAQADDEAKPRGVSQETVGFSLTLETLSSQDLAEPTACCYLNQERGEKYLNGDLSLQDIMNIAVHLNECSLCSKQREIEEAIRSMIKRCCLKDQAPDRLKTKIVVQINTLTEELE